METLQLTKVPSVKTTMLIRKPVAQVFEAFIDPEITNKFWFTKSSGKLDVGREVKWEWEMYGVSTQVKVLKIEEYKRIGIEWGTDEVTYVDWDFEARSSDETMVTITTKGFSGNGDEIAESAIDSMGGFTMVLCALKAYLEYSIQLNVVADKSPDANIRS